MINHQLESEITEGCAVLECVLLGLLDSPDDDSAYDAVQDQLKRLNRLTDKLFDVEDLGGYWGLPG